MIYVTERKKYAQYKELTFEDFFLGEYNEQVSSGYIGHNDTITRVVSSVPERVTSKIYIPKLIQHLKQYNNTWKHLIDVKNKQSLYHSFKIPKRSGGFRQINAPNDELMFALRCLKSLFEKEFNVLYHDCAFAYIPKRNIVNALERHQKNKSRWFLKIDCKKFFDNTTMEFVINQLSMIFPFNEVMSIEEGKNALSTALSLCFLNNGLPQGTPISPLLTNLVMIPIDHAISSRLYKKMQNVAYTRYADDMHISSKVSFDWKDIQSTILSIFEEFHTPFTLNFEKTHYGSSAGRNWILGLMLNQNNNITIGHQKKKQFKVMTYSLLTNHDEWSVEDAYEYVGIMSYYKSVEPVYISALIKTYEEKYGKGRTVSSIIKEILN